MSISATAPWGEIMGRFALLLTGVLLWLLATGAPSSAEDYAKIGPFAVGLRKFTIRVAAEQR